MAITLNGTTGVTTTGLTSNGIDDNATSTAMTLDSSGNVGIGNTSPSSYNAGSRTLVIGDGGTEGISIHAGTGMLHFTNGADTTERVSIKSTVASNTLEFTTGGSEAMRLDASGNLLVGQSSTTQPGVGNTTTGFGIRDNGLFFASAYNGRTGTFSRSGTDGPILGIYKDGSSVGSIGVEGNDITIDGGVSNHSGLRFSSPSILPRYNGALADNQVDLGQTGSNYRFKDLYLSGGVYLGGTGSANKLDDYEEGTFTPVVGSTGGGSTTAGTFSGRYTKVGNLVTVQFVCVDFTFSGGSGFLRLTGFPFTASQLSGRPTRGGSVAFYRYDLPDTGYGYVMVELPSTGVMTFLVPTDDSTWTGVTVENNSGLYVEGMMTYYTS